METIKNYEVIIMTFMFLGMVRTIIKHEFKQFEESHQSAQNNSTVIEVLEDVKIELVDSKLREDGLEEIVEDTSRVLEKSREMIKMSKPLLRDLELRYLKEDMQKKQEQNTEEPTPKNKTHFQEMK